MAIDAVSTIRAQMPPEGHVALLELVQTRKERNTNETSNYNIRIRSLLG